MDLINFQSMGEVAASNMAHDLTSLLERDVSVSLSVVIEKERSSLSSSLSGKYICALVKCFGKENFLVFILTKEIDSIIISNLLIEGDHSKPCEIMNEHQLSEYNVVVQHLVVALENSAKMFSRKKIFEIKEILLLDSNILENKLLLNDSEILVISFGIFVQGLLSSEIYFCVPVSVVNVLVSEKEIEDHEIVSVKTMNNTILNNFQKQSGGVVVEQLENESVVPTRPIEGNIGLLLDVPLKMTVELGRTTKLVKEILAMASGSVVELDKLAGEAVDILINEKLIAKGEVVVIDENFGVRVTEILNPEERLTAVQS